VLTEPGDACKGQRRADILREVYAETERAGLCEFLDMQREALIEKLHGVSDADARRASTVSSLSLLSLVKHSAIWERRWFQVVVAGRSVAGEWPEVQPQDENAFRLTDDDTVETVVTYYREQIAASQEILRTVELDAPCAWPGIAGNLRWVAMHMIEETARHAGHADIIRETIDSSRAWQGGVNNRMGSRKFVYAAGGWFRMECRW
jgi:hypothetical protein